MAKITPIHPNRLRLLYENAGETEKPEISEIQWSRGEKITWLSGTYLKVGPGFWHFPQFSMKHYLDGYASVAKFTFLGNGHSVSFENKYLQSDVFMRAKENGGRPVVQEFGTNAFTEKKRGWIQRCLNSIVS